MTTRVITKALATEQDLAYGEGVVEQTRAGVSYELDMIRGFRPCNSQEELLALDPGKFPKACITADGAVSFYAWDGTKYSVLSLSEVNQLQTPVLNFPDLATAVASTNIGVGDALNLAERIAGNGGGAMWDVVLASTVTPNTFNIVQCTGISSLALALRVGAFADAKEFGTAGDGVTDDSGAFQAALNSGKPVNLEYNDTYDTTELTLNSNSGISGDSVLGSRINTDTGITVNGAFTEISNISTGASEAGNPAITYTGNGFNYFGNLIKDSRTSGPTGISIDAIETKLDRNYLNGNWDGNDATAGGNGVNITNWDTSMNMNLIQDYKYGVSTTNGLQANDLHIVRASTALTLRDQGAPCQFLNTYIDTPYNKGIVLYNQSNASFVGTHFLKIGADSPNSSDLGIYLDADSNNNSFFNTNFNQPTPSSGTNPYSFMQINSTNNLFVGLSGSYACSADNRKKLRKQTIMGATGSWARHNNVVRFNRASSGSVSAGAQATLNFYLEWAPSSTTTYNTFLWQGTFVARTSASRSGYGKVYIPIRFNDVACSPVIEPISPTADQIASNPANVNFSIVSASLTDNVLSVVVQNDSTSGGYISIELAKAPDAGANSF